MTLIPKPDKTQLKQKTTDKFLQKMQTQKDPTTYLQAKLRSYIKNIMIKLALSQGYKFGLRFTH